MNNLDTNIIYAISFKVRKNRVNIVRCHQSGLHLNISMSSSLYTLPEKVQRKNYKKLKFC